MQVPTENTHHQPLFTFTLNVINSITHLSLGAVAFGAICYANLFSAQTFTTHIYLCVIGYVILMAQAVLSMNPYNGWSNILSHPDKKISHWVMQVLGSILAIIGTVLRLIDNDLALPSRSSHGILGITAMVLTIVSFLGGVLNIYSARLRLHVSLIRICHTLVGSFVLITAFAALCLGFDGMYRAVMGHTNANLMIAFTIISLIGTVMSGFIRIFSRICV